MPDARGAAGIPLDTGSPVIITLRYGDATPVDMPFFTATRTYRVHKIIGRPLVGASGATGVIKKAASGTAVASGTALHSGTYDFNGTANTNQPLTLSATAADLNIASGDSIGVDVTGTLTNATGTFTLELIPTS